MAGKIDERSLVFKFKQAKEKKDATDKLLKNAKKEFDKIELQLMELLEAKSAEATARYDGIGYVRMNKPKLYASCNVGNRPELFEHLKKVNREDLIKTDVAAGTLSTYVKECVENGVPIPDFISYYLRTSLRLYK